MEGFLVILVVSSLTSISADIPKHHISARSAKSFLLDPVAIVQCPDASFEIPYCETNTDKCSAANENVRESKCRNICPGQACVFDNPCPAHGLTVKCIPDPCDSHTCHNGGTCTIGWLNPLCNCPPGYHGDHCSTTPCHSFTCLNGGTCNNVGSKAVCTCRPGFIHDDCGYAPCDFFTCLNGGTCNVVNDKAVCSCRPGFVNDDCGYEPCAHYVCHNGGTCKVVGTQAACDCTPGYETDVCKLDCRPGPVDVVFVLDGSVSQSNGLNTSIEFVRKFINQVPVGKNDFQFALITYSTDASVIFDFNTTKSEIESALMGVRFQEGATFTKKGLHKAHQILTDSSSGVRMTVSPKYVILLTDGLSTDRFEAINYAEITNSNEYRIMTVGIGYQVDHSEILQLASNSSYVYSPETDDAFNRMMLESCDQDCKNCSESTTTDVFILLDTSSANQTQSQYHTTVGVLKTLVKQLQVKDTDVQVGLAKFDETVDPVFVLNETLDTDSMLSHIVTIRRSKDVTVSNATTGLRFGLHEGFKPENGGRINSRRIVVLFSNGHWKDINATKNEIISLAENNIIVFIVGTARDANIKNLFDAVTSAFNVIYVLNSETEGNVQSIISETKYVNCKDGLFD